MNTVSEQPAAPASEPDNRDAVNVLTSAGTLDRTRAWTELHLADGRVLRLDTRALKEGASDSPGMTARTRPAEEVVLDDQVTVPLIEEHLVLEKRVVETGRVRLRKTVESFEQQLDEPLAVNTFDVERIILNQVIESVPEVRYEGDTTIYPVVEERVVLSKQLVLKEEVRVTRRVSERRDTQVVTLHREHLTVEREPLTVADDDRREDSGNQGADRLPPE